MSFADKFYDLLGRFNDPENTSGLWVAMINFADDLIEEFPEYECIVLGWLDAMEERLTGKKIDAYDSRKEHWKNVFLEIRSGEWSADDH